MSSFISKAARVIAPIAAIIPGGQIVAAAATAVGTLAAPKPKTPSFDVSIPSLETKTPTTPTNETPAVQEAAQDERQKRAAQVGRAATVLTGGQGVQDDEEQRLKKKTLLGE